ncbi:MAG: hypothetical protein AAF351_13145 [Pseudomonadota bacterium]
MTTTQLNATWLGIVLCRVGAAVLAVQAISYLGYLSPGLFLGEWNGELMTFLAVSVVPALAAVMLWRFAPKICDVAGFSDNSGTDVDLSGATLIAVGTALIGVWVLAEALIFAAGVEVQNYWRYQPDPDQLDPLGSQLAGNRASYVLRIVFGLLLLFGKDSIAALIQKARRVGVTATD